MFIDCMQCIDYIVYRLHSSSILWKIDYIVHRLYAMKCSEDIYIVCQLSEVCKSYIVYGLSWEYINAYVHDFYMFLIVLLAARFDR